MSHAGIALPPSFIKLKPASHLGCIPLATATPLTKSGGRQGLRRAMSLESVSLADMFAGSNLHFEHRGNCLTGWETLASERREASQSSPVPSFLCCSHVKLSPSCGTELAQTWRAELCARVWTCCTLRFSTASLQSSSRVGTHALQQLQRMMVAAREQ